jgi:hypothetical protein
MNDQISDFKATLYRIQLWFELHPRAYQFIIFSFSFITLVMALMGFFMSVNFIMKIIVFLILITLLILLVIIDSYHMNIIRINHFELEQRKRLISELVSIEKNIYKVKYRREVFDIETNGDASYTREMILEYDNSDVAWAEMLFGTTNEYGSNFDQMILKAYTFPDTKYALSRVPIEIIRSRMRFAIILRNKITTLHRTEGYQISLKWLGAWKLLVYDNKDGGILRVDYDTSECVLELRLPPGYSFVDFRMPRTNGELIYGKNNDGRAYLAYRLKDLSKGDVYSYFVEITKGK